MPSGVEDVQDESEGGGLVVGLATEVVPFVFFVSGALLPSLVSLVVGSEGEGLEVEEWHEASCLAARKLLRSELVNSRLERYAPGLRIMEGPAETILLPLGRH